MGESSGEDDGYIITVLYNGKAKESEMVILSARDLSLQTRVPLGMAVPHGLHGCFNSGDQFTSEEIERRAKLADKMESRGSMWNEVKSDFSGLGLRLDDLEEYFGDMM
jgi:all-trans-8'-apo-beta-carotenal 15,15'-oxygenase